MQTKAMLIKVTMSVYVTSFFTLGLYGNCGQHVADCKVGLDCGNSFLRVQRGNIQWINGEL